MTNQKETGWNLRNSYAELPNIFFTPLDPNPVSSPKIVKFNDSLAAFSRVTKRTAAKPRRS